MIRHALCLFLPAAALSENPQPYYDGSTGNKSNVDTAHGPMISILS
jgi:hypothetical protein